MGITIFARNGTRDDFLNHLLSTITHIASGDDDTTPVSTDTTLGNETFREAVFDSGINVFGAFFRMFQDTTENNGNDIKEEGVFDDATTGNMFTRNITFVTAKDSNTEVFIDDVINEDVVNA